MAFEFENRDPARGGARPETDCKKARRLFIPFLDREASPEEAALVAEHVASCASCASDLALHREIGDALRETARNGEVRPRDLAARVRAAPPARAPDGWAFRAAAAAVLLGAAGLAFWTLRAPHEPRGAADPAGLEVAAQVLENLDILETLDEEGMEPTIELVEALLALEAEESEARAGEVLDPSLFRYLLEEEIPVENL